jgi:hypothetical protein
VHVFRVSIFSSLLRFIFTVMPIRWATAMQALGYIPVQKYWIFAAAKMAHLSDDETVAKMGHPSGIWSDPPIRPELFRYVSM